MILFDALIATGKDAYLTVALGVNVWLAMSMPGAVRCSAGDPIVKQRL